MITDIEEMKAEEFISVLRYICEDMLEEGTEAYICPPSGKQICIEITKKEINKDFDFERMTAKEFITQMRDMFEDEWAVGKKSYLTMPNGKQIYISVKGCRPSRKYE